MNKHLRILIPCIFFYLAAYGEPFGCSQEGNPPTSAYTGYSLQNALKVQHIVVGGGLLLLYTTHRIKPEFTWSKPPAVKICSGAAQLTIAALSILGLESHKRLRALSCAHAQNPCPPSKITPILQYYFFLDWGVPGVAGIISGVYDSATGRW